MRPRTVASAASEKPMQPSNVWANNEARSPSPVKSKTSKYTKKTKKNAVAKRYKFNPARTLANILRETQCKYVHKRRQCFTTVLLKPLKLMTR